MYLITNDYRNVIRLKADIMTKSLQDYTKEELIEQIKSLKKTKKFGLVWEDKPEQVAIDCETKLPVLTEVTERAITKADDRLTTRVVKILFTMIVTWTKKMASDTASGCPLWRKDWSLPSNCYHLMA